MRVVGGVEVFQLVVGKLEVLRVLVDLWKKVLKTVVEDGNALLQFWK